MAIELLFKEENTLIVFSFKDNLDKIRTVNPYTPESGLFICFLDEALELFPDRTVEKITHENGDKILYLI